MVPRGTEAADAAREHQEAFRMAVRTADSGKPAARIAAVEVALDHLLDNGQDKTNDCCERFKSRVSALQCCWFAVGAGLSAVN